MGQGSSEGQKCRTAVASIATVAETDRKVASFRHGEPRNSSAPFNRCERRALRRLVAPATHLRLVDPHPNEELSDEALLAQAAKGDPSAFADLAKRYERSLLSFCRALVGDGEAARDLAQDTLLEVWRARQRYLPTSTFRAYLFTIARNRGRSLGRWRSIRRFVGLDQLKTTVESPAAPLLVADRDRQLWASLERLPEHFRIPLVLRFVEELEYEEIAAIIGRTPSTARSRVHYALKALADLLPLELTSKEPT